MSEPTRPRTRGPAERRQRSFRVQAVTQLEDRKLLTPFLTIAPPVATFTAATTQPPNTTTGTVTVTINPATTTTTTTTTGFESAAPLVSVTELTPISSFGGDIVRIEAGPGGSFGDDVYAISRGAGANSGAINRPGVIYRVDPATGQASVFFDLNTVVNQLSPGDTAANSVGTSTGLVNWYDMTFDPEGVFDGIPSLFVASVDRSDPAKNAIYQIGANGQLISVFSQFTDGQSALKFAANPSAILVPPVEQQSFLNGLISGSGSGASTISADTFTGLFFNANEFRPGTPISSSTLPFGVTETGLTLGPQTSITSANSLYDDTVYDTYADFGTPAAGGIPAQVGDSGVQGLAGELLINDGVFPTTPTTAIDTYPSISTSFRRLEDSAFDYYGYFSYGMTIGTATTTGTGSGTPGVGTGTTTLALGAPTYVGSLFVADLGTGLAVSLTTPNAPAGVGNTIVPVQGPGGATVVNPVGGLTPSVSAPSGNIGGRIVRISPTGVVTDFAEGFDTVGSFDSSSFVNSSLSISFSADGTTLYASDNDAIWQFKSVADLASSTSGSLIGLNDLRTFGVPYDGQGTAVAVIDSGVDATNPNFRGRVSLGTNIVTGGPGNDDLAGVSNIGTTTGGTGGTGGGTGGTGGNGTGTGTNTGVVTGVSEFGHGTLVAGIIAQFVPQATIVPVNIFNPFVSEASTTSTTGTGTGGTGTTTGITAATNALTTSQNLYLGLNYVATHPYVADPVRPGQYDRLTTVNLGFGTTQTFDSEGSAFQAYPQIVIALKNQMDLLRRRGIQPIAAAGQFGAPFGSTTTTTTTGTGTSGTGNLGDGGTNNAQNANVGDTNGMSLPAILNEVVSVTGVIPFPYETGPSQIPTKPAQGVFPRPIGPVLLFGSTTTIGAIGGTTTTTTSTSTNANNLAQLTNGNSPSFGTLSISSNTTGTGTGTTANAGGELFYSDAILAAANRGVTTDYAAPALDTPTFASTFSGNADMDNNFTTAGTSMSAAIVTGAFDMVSSALQYWNTLNKTGVTSDAYLTTPVGVDTLNFGPHPFKNLLGYNNPDGINSILQWTSTPVVDANNGLTESTPQMIAGTTSFPSYSRIDVGNAIEAIEGDIAITYLLKHNDFNLIDANHDGLITAQELTNFVNNAAAMGQPEAGAMAALLGGTARVPTASTATDQFIDETEIGPYDATIFGEQPDQPDAEQRRYNFFDYVSDGQLNGAISINQFKMLAHTLLPSPTAFVVVDRQRSSTSGYLDNPNVPRDYVALQHLQPSYEFVSKYQISKYKNLSPNDFKVNRNDTPSTLTFPVYQLFDGKGVTTATPAATTSSTAGSTVSTSSTSSTASTPSSTTSTGATSTAGTGTSASTAASTPTSVATTASETPAPSTTASSSSTVAAAAASSSTAPSSGTSSSSSTTPLNQQFGSALGTLLTDLNTPPQTASSTTTTTPTTTSSTGTSGSSTSSSSGTSSNSSETNT